MHSKLLKISKNNQSPFLLKSHDYFYIGHDGGEFTSYTGRIPPQTNISAVDSDMILRFTSDNRVTKLGLKIRIDYVDDGK